MTSAPTTDHRATGEGASNAQRDRILVVDDERAIRLAATKVLRKHGWDVEEAENGNAALERLAQEHFDLVLTDIWMPDLDGMGLLRKIREQDLSLPVVVMTAAPSVDSAVEAIELGAVQYLRKPFAFDELVKAVRHGFHIRRMNELRQSMAAVSKFGVAMPSDLAGLEACLDRTLGRIWMAFQPLVRPQSRTIYGYEALLRSDEPELPNPLAVLDAAERTNRVGDVTLAVATQVGQLMVDVPDSGVIFLNLHPTDFRPDQLARIHALLGERASDLVLEVTERSRLPDIQTVRSSLVYLRERGYRVALDDLGAGYASLSSFTKLEPDIVKIDRDLVSDIDASPPKQKVVESLVSLCHAMDIEVVGEGVETEAESATLDRMGVDLQQGYLFAKPGKPFPEVTW